MPDTFAAESSQTLGGHGVPEMISGRGPPSAGTPAWTRMWWSVNITCGTMLGTFGM